MKSSVGLAIFTASALLVVARGAVVHRAAARLRGSVKDKEVGEADDDDDDESSCEIELVNTTNEPLLFCWVGESGDLHHFYPCHQTGAIEDGSVSNSHVEFTHIGHAFVCLRMCRQTTPKTLQSVPADSFVFIYRPLLPKHRHVIRIADVKGRGAKVVSEKMDMEVVDTTQKTYNRVVMRGFTVMYEEDVFKDCEALTETIDGDLREIKLLLPRNLCKRLELTTKLYLNKSLTYGPRARPVIGRGACYHPFGGASWLKKNGCSVDKEGCIEFYSVEDYLSSHSHWGKGGGLLHEFCHAVHNQILKDGFDNEEVRQAYSIAMDKRLYDSVAVHGRTGRHKAYACANAMEFFAELSTAFLAREKKTEFNKWFPFNRYQLREHDIETYHVLERLWSQSFVIAKGDSPSSSPSPSPSPSPITIRKKERE